MTTIQVTEELQAMLENVSELRKAAFETDDPQNAQHLRASHLMEMDKLVDYLHSAIEQAKK